MESFNAMACKLGLSADERLHYAVLGSDNPLLAAIGEIEDRAAEAEDRAAVAKNRAAEAEDRAAVAEDRAAEAEDRAAAAEAEMAECQKLQALL